MIIILVHCDCNNMYILKVVKLFYIKNCMKKMYKSYRLVRIYVTFSVSLVIWDFFLDWRFHLSCFVSTTFSDGLDFFDSQNLGQN